MAENQDSRVKQAYEDRVRELNRSIERRERELAILSAVAARVHGEDEVQAIFEIALEEILENMDLNAAWIFTGEEKDQKLRLTASRGVADSWLEEVRTQGLTECLCPEVFWSGHRMQARNTLQCPRMPDIVTGLKAPVAHACIPLRFDGATRGVLNVAARPGEVFSDEELRFLETLGHQVGLAVERARHREKERRRDQEARAMAAINRAIGGSLDAAVVLDAVSRTAVELLGVDQVHVLLGADPRALQVAHVWGSAGPTVGESGLVDLVESPWNLGAQALLDRVVVCLDDREADPRTDRAGLAEAGIASAIALPLIAHDQLLGVLVVARQVAHHWGEAQVELAEGLAAQAAIALESARLYEEARRAYDAERLRNAEARAMAAVSKAIGSSLDAGAVLKAIGQTALDLLSADRAHILLGSDPRDLVVAHLSGLSHPELRPAQKVDLLALDARLQVRAIEERRTFSIDDWSTDPRVNNQLAMRWGSLSGLIVPLLSREGPLGLLAVSCTTVRHWTDEQVDVAEALANQASVALENARLYAETRRAFQELKDAQARIIQNEKMAVLGTFASGLAHEVRNPLNSMALQLSILERRIHKCEPSLAREMGELTLVIREEIKRLDSLVSDFLLFSRTSRIQYRPAHLDALVDEVMRLLLPEALGAGVNLKRLSVGEPVPSLQMDAEKMKQVVINLVRNAIEAMPEGGVVTVESGVMDGRVRLAVRDNGPGLPDNLDVFQLFVTTKAKGTGLGLSIVQQIVMQHGGEITASNGEKGAVFTITLPIPASAPRGQEVRA